MNRKSQVGISLSAAVRKVAAGIREITVKVSGSKGRHGSGTVWRPGLIVTNAHVANSQVHECGVRNRTPFDLIAAIRSASHLRAGEMVLALGNPFDGRGSVTTGIVHCPVGKSPWLLADIRLAPGYSGGPLAETSGAVIGINSMIVGQLGYAITSDAVEEFLSRFHLSEAA
jgi:serine protease Do